MNPKLKEKPWITEKNTLDNYERSYSHDGQCQHFEILQTDINQKVLNTFSVISYLPWLCTWEKPDIVIILVAVQKIQDITCSIITWFVYFTSFSLWCWVFGHQEVNKPAQQESSFYTIIQRRCNFSTKKNGYRYFGCCFCYTLQCYLACIGPKSSHDCSFTAERLYQEDFHNADSLHLVSLTHYRAGEYHKAAEIFTAATSDTNPSASSPESLAGSHSSKTSLVLPHTQAVYTFTLWLVWL